MSTTLYGYLRPHSSIAAHEVADATDERLGSSLSWSSNDWRNDPDWPCVAIGWLTIDRVPLGQLVPQQIELLRKQQKELLAAAQAAAVEIDRQINNLLAIEHAS